MTNTMHLPCWWGCDVGCCRAENRSERVPERRQAFTRSQGECRLSVLSGVPAALNCVMASLDLPRPRPPRSLGHGHQKPRCLANTSKLPLSSTLSPFLCHAPSFYLPHLISLSLILTLPHRYHPLSPSIHFSLPPSSLPQSAPLLPPSSLSASFFSLPPSLPPAGTLIACFQSEIIADAIIGEEPRETNNTLTNI